MDRIELSAPGKAVLMGEYAVLFGAPAAVAAVDRRALVTIGRAAGDSWEVSAPGLAKEAATFHLGSDGAVSWHDEKLGRGSYALVESIVSGIAGSGAFEFSGGPPLEMILDTREFFEDANGEARKLGLGSSAALTVALTTALEVWSVGGNLPSSDRDRLRALADLHRAVQGGKGSGIDVAASLLGGVIRYRLDAAGSVAEASPLSVPEELKMVFAWTGRSASTGGFLERLEARLAEAPAEVRPALDELAEVSTTGLTALAGAYAGEFLDAVDAFWSALERLAVAIAMPILSAEHRVLRRLADDCGVRYKPSGAGGGDLGLGFTTDAGAALLLAERAASAGFRVLDLGIDPMGVARTVP